MSELHYTDAEKIKRLSTWHESEKAEIEKLKATIANLTAFNESMQTDADRANLRIIAKDMQISELTRMLFALGKQDGQTIRELTEENRGLRQMLHMETK